jgi:hypothetical protein
MFVQWKESLNSGCQQFHRYQKNEQSPLIQNIVEYKMTMTHMSIERCLQIDSYTVPEAQRDKHALTYNIGYFCLYWAV